MPEVFGWEHLTYTAVFLALAIAAIVLILKYVKTEKTLSMIMRIIGGVLFICILWNRISICVSHKNALLLIPDTFCGISSLFFHSPCFSAKGIISFSILSATSDLSAD